MRPYQSGTKCPIGSNTIAFFMISDKIELMPEIIKGTSENLSRVAEILSKGGVIVFPTDTAYGLGVNGSDSNAVEKIFAIKGRSTFAPISIAVSDINMAKRYGEFSQSALTIAEKFLPGPLTLVVPARERLPKELLAGGTTVGFRIPNEPWLLKLIQTCNFPITATSANASGSAPCYAPDDVKQSLDENWNMIDIVIDGGTLAHEAVSTVVECVGDSIRILREGPISGEQIENVLNSN